MDDNRNPHIPCEIHSTVEKITHISSQGWDTPVNLQNVHIGCIVHDTHSIHTYRTLDEAYRTFRCDKGQNLRFMITYADQDYPPILCDLGQMVTNVKHYIEDAHYGQDVPRFAIFQVKVGHSDLFVNTSVPELEKLRIMFKDTRRDDNDFSYSDYDITDNTDAGVASFTTRINNRA